MATKTNGGDTKPTVDAMATNGTEPIVFYEDEENLKKLCNFLRSNEGPPVREAIEMDKRVYYLKGRLLRESLARKGTTLVLTLFLSFIGEKLVNFLVEPKKGTKWPKDLPKFQSRTQAIAVCKDLCKYGFVHRSEKRGKGVLAVSITATCSIRYRGKHGMTDIQSTTGIASARL
jgi:hypothetical protein